MKKTRKLNPSPSAESGRTKKVVDSILSRLSQLSVGHSVTSEDEDQPGDYARAVLKKFKGGVSATAAASRPAGKGK